MIRSLAASFGPYRYVLLNFVTSDLKVKYRGSVAGYFWTLLEPLALVGTYYFLFGVIAKVHQRAYPLSLIVGVLPWTYFANVVQGGANSLTGNANLIRKVFLPREIFLLSMLGSNFIVFVLSMAVLVPLMIFYGVAPEPSRLLLLPVGLLLLTTLAYGFGLLGASLNVLYRDVGYVVRVVLRMGMYVSPVIYAVDMVPAGLRDLYLLNPLAVALSLVRLALLPEPSSVELWHVITAIFSTAAIGFGSAALFTRWEPEFVKLL